MLLSRVVTRTTFEFARDGPCIELGVGWVKKSIELHTYLVGINDLP